MTSIQDIRAEIVSIHDRLDGLIGLIDEGVTSDVDVVTLRASIMDLVVEKAEEAAANTAENIADEVRYLTAEVDTYGLDGDIAGLLSALGLE